MAADSAQRLLEWAGKGLFMDPMLLIAIIVAGIAIAAIAALVLLRRDSGSGVAALTERLAQMTDLHAASQVQLAQQLQAQERALAKSLDERLTQTATRVNESLEKNSRTQKTSLDELKERLVRIDAAQKNISELSSQMVGLQDILSNKQARGAFGEVQLHDLVSKVLPPRQLRNSGDARQWPARRLPAQAAQSAGADRHRRQVSARIISRVAKRQERGRP